MATILCVDDVADNLDLLKVELEDVGHDVRLAASGVEALDSVRQSRPDLILLDVLMPDLNGMEVLRRLRELYSLVELPILMVTVVDDEANVIAALRMGANDYLSKPLEMEVMLARVDTHLRVQQLARERDKLLDLKNKLIGICVHDLTQPALVMSILAESLLGELPVGSTVAKKDRETVHLVAQAASTMQVLVRSLLDLQMIESGELVLSRESLELHRLVGAAVDAASAYASTKKTTLHTEFTESTNLWADEKRLMQVMGNLIDNAIKYSPRGSRVDVRVSSTASGVRVEVKDEGPGFPEKERERLFQKFSRLTPSPTGGETSTGLGLFTVRCFVEAHGGSVGAENNMEGRGATFWFTLNQRQPSKSSQR